MSNRNLKPQMSASDLIYKLKYEKGISFKYTDEKEAEKYLTNINNYLRTVSYRRNYARYQNGDNVGKYIHLDFAYLQELSVLDMHLRFIIIKMCLDIEHALKVGIVRHSEKNPDSDGYEIVEEFLKKNPYIIETLQKKSNSPFCGELIRKYFIIKQEIVSGARRKLNRIEAVDCPIWVLMELLSFGDTIKFYEFYNQKYHVHGISSSIINLVRNLRNGCAHNNCILADLSQGASYPPVEIGKMVGRISDLGKKQRAKKLSCRPMLEFVSMLYVYNEIVTEKVKYHRLRELRQFFEGRMKEKAFYYESNELITSSYKFAYKVLIHICLQSK